VASEIAVRVEPAWDDLDKVLNVVKSVGPYRPLARYATTDAERKAAGRGGKAAQVPPWFRFDVATHGEVHADGGAALLDNAGFIAAAHKIFGLETIVEPTTLYVNVMTPCSFPFAPHTDIPMFRGRSRQNTPTWLLLIMHLSGLFETERIKMATGVSWIYDGPGGDFVYWPEGALNESVRESSPFSNVAIVADNERVNHGVAPLGHADAVTISDLSMDAEIRHDGRAWVVADDGKPDRTFTDDEVRITLSWKASIFANKTEQAQVAAGVEELSVEEVANRLAADLKISVPADPLTNDGWIETLAGAYPKPELNMPDWSG